MDDDKPLSGLRVVKLGTDLSQSGANNDMVRSTLLLRELGAEVEQWTLTGGGEFEERLRAGGVPFRPLRMQRQSYRLDTTRKLVAWLQEARPDVLHTHNYEPNFHASLARLLTPLKHLFIQEHDPRLRWHRVLAMLALHKVPDVVIVRSPSQGHFWQRLFRVPGERVFVLMNPVDTARFAPRAADAETVAELGVEGCYPVVGYASTNFPPHKGVELLLRAFACLRREFPEARLVLIGGVERHLRRLRARAAGLGVGEAVVFTGRRQDMPRLLAALDIYVQPSFADTDPSATKEAMAMGKPVIATATWGVRDWLRDGDTGFLVPTGDWRAIAERLLQVARDRKLAERLGQAARRQAEEEFSPALYRQRLVELYVRFGG
jgi:glycosyltransferase involved in cell wall biosynthesis